METEFDPLNYHTIMETIVAALLRKPLQSLPLAEPFPGAGVYMLYYSGDFEPYRPISRTDTPIYIGKAIPKGSRRGPSALSQIERTTSPSLYDRLRDHWQSLEAAENLELTDFQCRYLVVTPIWITIAESLLIENLRPVWNAVVDGFGLHDPGGTRHTQKRSDWDTLHPGRPWGPKMRQGKTVQEIRAAIRGHFG